MAQVYKTKSELVDEIAKFIADTIEHAVKKRGKCSIVLAGGNTPRDVYRALAEEPFFSRINWKVVHFFWGDERMVPPDHDDSNFGMARKTLLTALSIPAANIHRIKGELSPSRAAREYYDELSSFFQTEPFQFDLVLLGIGDDGHTASLFPGTEAVTEKNKLVSEVFVPKLDKWRVTLTLPLINKAWQTAFIVAGSAKTEIVRDLFYLEEPQKKWPASMVQPDEGELCWMLDAEAAELLDEYKLSSY